MYGEFLIDFLIEQITFQHYYKFVRILKTIDNVYLQ